MVLPQVHRRPSSATPPVYRFFFLEHNLERFATNRFQHQQPFFYYVVVLLIGDSFPGPSSPSAPSPDSVEVSIAEWKVPPQPPAPAISRPHPRRRRLPRVPRPLGSLSHPLLLLVLRIQISPGYILPSIPPPTILAADYLNRIRRVKAFPNGFSGATQPSAPSWSSSSSSLPST